MRLHVVTKEFLGAACASPAEDAFIFFLRLAILKLEHVMLDALP